MNLTSIYPSEKELEEVERWDVLEKGLPSFLMFISSIWYCGEAEVRGEGFELHTYGWSGNTNIISAMRNNYVFWSKYFIKKEPGGHYYFKI